MKHEFTDTQLRQAVANYLEDAEVDLSISALGDFFWSQQVKALRKMLDALPEPATDEQRGAARELRKFAHAQDTWCAEGRDEQRISRIAMRDALLKRANELERADQMEGDND